jgi:hypothetical protein
MNGPTRICRGCYGPLNPTIVVYRASCAVVLEARLPVDRAEPWKTHRTRFPQLLGRRTERAAHNGPQACFFSF